MKPIKSIKRFEGTPNEMWKVMREDYIKEKEDKFIRCFQNPSMAISLLGILKSKDVINKDTLEWINKKRDATQVAAMLHQIKIDGHFNKNIKYPNLSLMAKDVFNVSVEAISIRTSKGDQRLFTRIGFIF